MKKVQKTSTAEFKREAVRLAQTSGKPIAQVARELGSSLKMSNVPNRRNQHGSCHRSTQPGINQIAILIKSSGERAPCAMNF